MTVPLLTGFVEPVPGAELIRVSVTVTPRSAEPVLSNTTMPWTSPIAAAPSRRQSETPALRAQGQTEPMTGERRGHHLPFLMNEPLDSA